MKLLILLTLIMANTYAGNCSIKGRIRFKAPIISAMKHKQIIENISLLDCIDAAKKALSYDQLHSVSICGGAMGADCGSAELRGNITKVKYKYTDSEYKIRGIVK